MAMTKKDKRPCIACVEDGPYSSRLPGPGLRKGSRQGRNRLQPTRIPYRSSWSLVDLVGEPAWPGFFRSKSPEVGDGFVPGQSSS